MSLSLARCSVFPQRLPACRGRRSTTLPSELASLLGAPAAAAAASCLFHVLGFPGVLRLAVTWGRGGLRAAASHPVGPLLGPRWVLAAGPPSRPSQPPLVISLLPPGLPFPAQTSFYLGQLIDLVHGTAVRPSVSLKVNFLIGFLIALPVTWAGTE